jgi:hypothetical protein
LLRDTEKVKNQGRPKLGGLSIFCGADDRQRRLPIFQVISD